MTKRLNTQLEADGAEHLVLGHLLVQGIECFKAVTNQPGYDIIAVNPHSGRNARIQVKSRWANNKAGSFGVKTLDFDFLVHVALNRGDRRQGITDTTTLRDPDYYIFPIDVIQGVLTASGKVTMNRIVEFDRYKEDWIRISQFLS